MRIGFDAKRAFLNSSGLGNYSRNAINAIQKYSNGNNLILFTPETSEKLLKNQEHFEVVSPKSSTSKIYKTYWRYFKLAKEIELKNLDIFHGLSNELPKSIHQSTIRSVVTIHDLIFLRFPEFYKTIDRKIYYKKVKYACESADKIIAISKQTKNDIIEFLGIPSEKIEVVYQSIAPLFFNRNYSEKLHSRIQLPRDFILSVGTLEPRKNQLSTLKAVHSQGIKMPIVFVGNSTSYKKEIDSYISINKIDNDILFLSNISEIELAHIYTKAKLSIYNSFYEGFGLPVIESMACGCPVISSNVSCLPETAGGAALLCNPGEAADLSSKIQSLILDEKLRNNMIEKGLDRAKEFHPRKYAENLISLYTKIAK
jgi:glycosyltransferase involved in cell wall biosynthesis